MSWVNSAGPRTGAGRMGLRAQEPPIASAPPRSSARICWPRAQHGYLSLEEGPRSIIPL